VTKGSQSPRSRRTRRWRSCSRRTSRITYLLPGTDNFAADGKVYYKINDVHIELSTDAKDLEVEGAIEAVLEEHGTFYDKTEMWIDTEKLYEVLYSFQMEG